MFPCLPFKCTIECNHTVPAFLQVEEVWCVNLHVILRYSSVAHYLAAAWFYAKLLHLRIIQSTQSRVAIERINIPCVRKTCNVVCSNVNMFIRQDLELIPQSHYMGWAKIPLLSPADKLKKKAIQEKYETVINYCELAPSKLSSKVIY